MSKNNFKSKTLDFNKTSTSKKKKKKRHLSKQKKEKVNDTNIDIKNSGKNQKTKEAQRECKTVETVVNTNKKNFRPMTFEEWQKKSQEIRRVFDPETGRHRLIRGEGEVIEEIVSKKRQREINKIATKTDGEIYAKHSRLY